MPNIGPAEILVILVVALIVFGPDKLPEIGRQVGRAMREFRRVQASFRDEVREVLEPREQTATPPQLPSPAPEPAGTGLERDADDETRTPGGSEEEPAPAPTPGPGEGHPSAAPEPPAD